MPYSFTIRGNVWKYAGDAGWFFVSVDKKESAKVKAKAGKLTGWRFVPVTVTLGKSTWETTLFPTKEGMYLLAIKASVRKKEKVGERSSVKISCAMR